MKIIRSIQNRIYEVRGERVLLDFDLAILYEAQTRVLNQAVKRNSKRFPADFMFQLTKFEYELLRSEIEATSSNLISQTVISSFPIGEGWGGKRKMPFAFTEQGVAMLSGVLNSDKAINMNIAIMRAFL
jgi:ORF6N domain